ncbi:unnamed protein product [Orchesella dallaii]|uniref:RIIa domain-containing protein n=1 Tax=Orchesella dallaii TaxID=48710 RepID=A0ABP1QNT4_9HEXA
MDGTNRPRYRVPDELRETLLDFTIAYLLERPLSLPEFGFQFFARLRGGYHAPESGAQPNAQGGVNQDATNANLTVEMIEMSEPPSQVVEQIVLVVTIIAIENVEIIGNDCYTMRICVPETSPVLIGCKTNGFFASFSYAFY